MYYFLHQMKLQLIPYIQKQIIQFIQFFQRHLDQINYIQEDQTTKNQWILKTNKLFKIMKKKCKQIDNFHYLNWQDYRTSFILRSRLFLTQFYQKNQQKLLNYCRKIDDKLNLQIITGQNNENISFNQQPENAYANQFSPEYKDQQKFVQNLQLNQKQSRSIKIQTNNLPIQQNSIKKIYKEFQQKQQNEAINKKLIKQLMQKLKQQQRQQKQKTKGQKNLSILNNANKKQKKLVPSKQQKMRYTDKQIHQLMQKGKELNSYTNKNRKLLNNLVGKVDISELNKSRQMLIEKIKNDSKEKYESKDKQALNKTKQKQDQTLSVSKVKKYTNQKSSKNKNNIKVFEQSIGRSINNSLQKQKNHPISNHDQLKSKSKSKQLLQKKVNIDSKQEKIKKREKDEHRRKKVGKKQERNHKEQKQQPSNKRKDQSNVLSKDEYIKYLQNKKQ